MTSFKVICVEVDCCLGVTLVASNCFGNDTMAVQGKTKTTYGDVTTLNLFCNTGEMCSSNVSRHLPGQASNLGSTSVSLLLHQQDTLLKCSESGGHQESACLQNRELTDSKWVGICVSLAVILFLVLAGIAVLAACKIRKWNHSKTAVSTRYVL